MFFLHNCKSEIKQLYIPQKELKPKILLTHCFLNISKTNQDILEKALCY